MTTFGYAYHSDSAEILKGRAAFKEINRIMRKRKRKLPEPGISR